MLIFVTNANHRQLLR